MSFSRPISNSLNCIWLIKKTIYLMTTGYLSKRMQNLTHSTRIITTSSNNQEFHHIFFLNNDQRAPVMQSSTLVKWGSFEQIKNRYSFKQNTNVEQFMEGCSTSKDNWSNHAMSYSRTMICQTWFLYAFTPCWRVNRLILSCFKDSDQLCNRKQKKESQNLCSWNLSLFKQFSLLNCKRIF